MVELEYMLDTNICIYLMDEQPASVIARFAKCKPGQVSLSSITWAELCCGMDTHNQPSEMMTLFSKLIPREFSMNAATIFGKLSQQFPDRKSSFDRMIAAHAISLDAILVTNNSSDFEAYKQCGLKLENWVAP